MHERPPISEKPQDPRGLKSILQCFYSQMTGKEGVDSDQARKIIGQTVGLMEDFQIDQALLASPIHTALVMGVAESLPEAKDPQEEKALIDVMKLASVLESHGQIYMTLNGKVKDLSEQGLPEGRWFDPDANHDDLFQKSADYDGFIQQKQCTELDQQGMKLLGRWGKRSVLHNVRTRLMINKRFERPYTVKVLDCTTAEMAEATGARGWCSPYDSVKEMVVSRDALSKPGIKTLQHEYAHSQADELNKGLWGLLLRGLSEATTESLVDHPMTYRPQREVLQILRNNSPLLESELPYAYQGAEESQIVIAREIISRYGFKGYTTIARMDAGNQSRFKNPIQQSIYLPTERVKDFIEEVDKKYYVFFSTSPLPINRNINSPTLTPICVDKPISHANH